MVTRRQYLATGLATATAAIAGCTSSGEGKSVSCWSSGGPTDGPVFDDPPAVSSDREEIFVLFVPIRRDAFEGTDVERVRVYERETLTHDLPVRSIHEQDADLEDDDPLVVQQTLGRIPGSGTVEVVAVDDAGERLESYTAEYSCRRGDLRAPSW